MNNQGIAGVLFLMAFMLTGMVGIVPAVPLALEQQTNAQPAFTPEELKQIQDYYDVAAQPSYDPEVDALIEGWRSGGALDSRVYAPGGLPSVLIFAAPWTDIESIRETVDLNWWVNMGLFKVAKAVLPSTAALNQLLEVDGVTTVSADKSIDPVAVAAETPIESGVDMTELRDVVGATGTVASGYTGAGVTVGHVDTGADFGVPDLQHAYDADSYDPTGSGLGYSFILGNSSVVNATEWLAAGNFLTFTNATGTYLNWTTASPIYCNYDGVNVLNILTTYLLAGGGLNGTLARAFFSQYMWAKPYKIPDPSAVSGDYHFGFMLQGKPATAGAGSRIMTPVLVYNSTSDDEWHLAVDWDGAWCYGNYYHGVFRYYTWDFYLNETKQAILDVIDFDFTDDIAVEDYSLTNPIVAHDYTGDGVDDYSIGSLCWVYDGISIYFDIFTDEFVFHGFRSDGNAFALYFDGDRVSGGHGTATAAHVASAGLYDYYDYSNMTAFKMKGIAPDATILSTKSITSGGWYGGLVWACGFSYNETTDEFYYTGDHQADLVTNSWGFITEPSSQFNYLSFTWEILSLSGIADPAYPGVLHVFSAGNEGSGFMTVCPPASAAAVLTVGASTSSKWLDYLYGPDQDIEGIASFTSKGPDFSGYVKPDILAPGLAAYSAVPTWAPFWIPQWAGVSWLNYTLFSGTSQSAPVAAGCAALVIEALNTAMVPVGPWVVKTILQSTAEDMGYDPATQGFGRVDVDAACDFVEGGGFWTWNLDSFYNNALLMDEAWSYWGTLSSETGVYFNESVVTLSDAVQPDGGIFFGAVSPGDVVTVHQDVFSDYATRIFAPAAATAMYMTYAESFSFVDTTFSYLDTVMVGEQMYGFFNLRDELGAAAYDDAVAAYTYVTIGVSFGAADVAGNEPWMFLYDWTDDDPNDGMPNLWNATSQEGNELTRLTSAANPTNNNMMPFATNLVNLDAILEGNMTLVIHDPVHDVAWNATGNSFTCTVIFWDEAVASEIVCVDDASDTYTYNITLTVPADADAGIYQGYVDNGDIRIPYSYTVMGEFEAAAGEVNTIVTGFGNELAPYDNPVYGSGGEDPDTWDFRSFTLYNTHATASYFGIRVIWADSDCDMVVTIYDAAGRDLLTGSALTATTTAMLVELGTQVTGHFYLLVHPVALRGGNLPVNYTVQVMWYEEVELAQPTLSYTSDDRSGVTVVGEGSTVWGDHAVLNVSYPNINLPNMPEYEVVHVSVDFLSGLYVERSGNVVDPGFENWPFNPSLTNTYASEIVTGITPGQVRLRLELFNPAADPALLVYRYNGVPLTAAEQPLITIDDGTTGDTVESGAFTATENMDIILCIYSFYYTGAYPDTYEVSVDTRVAITEAADGNEVIYDSYDFGMNATFAVKVTGTTETNIVLALDITSMTFQNYFAPVLSNIAVTGSGAVKTITWDVFDLNAHDMGLHTFEVLVSDDEGLTWQLLAKNLAPLADNVSCTYDWDSTGFYMKDYKIQVRVQDPYGLTSLIDSALFDAGTVPTVTVTTTTTTTTTTTATGIEILYIGLIGGIGVGVVIVLILFLVRKK